MALMWKKQAGALTWGVWRMDEYPTASQRTQELAAVLDLLEALCGSRQVVCHEASGRPFLAHGRWEISISHTKGYVAVALHAGGRKVGIDIEHYRPQVFRIRGKFLSDDELVATEEADLTQQLLYWCAKETVYKALDVPGAELRQHIRVCPFERTGSEGVFRGYELKTGTRQEFPLRYFIHPEYVVVVSV